MSNYIDFASTDIDAIIAQYTAKLESITGETVDPASWQKLFIVWLADVMAEQRTMVNHAANQNIPSRAEGANLDALGELYYNMERPGSKPATVTMRFTLSATQVSAQLIPAGTRVAPSSGSPVYATTEDFYIPSGEISADVRCVCSVAGVVGNGYTVGQINTLIDVFPYYASCENITESAGGSDAATDAEYYGLLVASQDAYSCAGSIGGYVYWAKSVSTDIADVKAIVPKEAFTATLDLYTLAGKNYAFVGGEGLEVAELKILADGTLAVAGTDYTAEYADGLLTISVLDSGALSAATQIDVEIPRLKAGHVYIYVLMNDGSLAGEEIKAAVLDACTDKIVRPMTDNVAVMDAETVDYEIDLTYYISRDSSKSAADIERDVQAAVDEYTAWQCARLGRDINPSELYARVKAAGVKRLELRSPTFTVLSDGRNNTTPQLAKAGSVNIVSGGYEDE